MSIPPSGVKSWSQLDLFPAMVMEFTLKVGVVLTDDHGQIQVEARNCQSGDLVGMWARPHVALSELPDGIAEAISELMAMIWDVSGPFR